MRLHDALGGAIPAGVALLTVSRDEAQAYFILGVQVCYTLPPSGTLYAIKLAGWFDTPDPDCVAIEYFIEKA
jgi:hypothetical protein